MFWLGKRKVSGILFYASKTYVCIGSYIGIGVDQFLPRLLIEQFDTLPSQYRHIEHMHEGVWFQKNTFFLTK